MIKSFANEDTENVYQGIYTHTVRRIIPSHLLKIAQRRLDMLNCTDNDNLASCFPGLKGEAGVRDAHGKYSIPIDATRRIAFQWDKGDAIHVEIKF